jgi:hypothetical protein
VKLPKPNLKKLKFHFSEIPEVILPLKTWLPEQNGNKIWLPEHQMVIKYGYWNTKWSRNMVTGTNLMLQLNMMLSMLMMDILNIIIIFQSDLYALVNIPTYHGVAHIHSTITKLAELRV